MVRSRWRLFHQHLWITRKCPRTQKKMIQKKTEGNWKSPRALCLYFRDKCAGLPVHECCSSRTSSAQGFAREKWSLGLVVCWGFWQILIPLASPLLYMSWHKHMEVIKTCIFCFSFMAFSNSFSFENGRHSQKNCFVWICASAWSTKSLNFLLCFHCALKNSDKGRPRRTKKSK